MMFTAVLLFLLQEKNDTVALLLLHQSKSFWHRLHQLRHLSYKVMKRIIESDKDGSRLWIHEEVNALKYCTFTFQVKQ